MKTGGDLAADVVVIGSGPCGAAASWALAAAGVDVLCLERGHAMDYPGLDRDGADWEARRAGPLSSNPNIRRDAGDDPVDDAGSPIKPMLAHAVGGTSPYWSAHVPRFRPADFTMASEDGVGCDWPLGYAELEPYYQRLETQWGAAFAMGDPTLPPRGAAPGRALPTIGAHGERLARVFDAKGWHWWPVDLVRGRPGTTLDPCTHPGPCDLGCPARHRSDAAEAFLAPALETGLRLETGCRVLRLEAGPDGRIVSALCRRDGAEFRANGRQFLLAGGGMGTPRLLMLSGLAQGSGQLGRNLMLHPYARVDGVFPEAVGGWLAREMAGIVSFEFYRTDRARGFARGMKLQLTSGPGPLATARGGASGRALPWGAGHHAAFEASFDHVLAFTVSADDLPEAENRITLSERLTDRDGQRAAKWHYKVGDNSRAILDFGMARARELLTAAGATETHDTPLRAQAGFHIMGTARMGTDPALSVCDPWGRVHEHPNLLVADSSAFVTASSINPTATAQALALRAAEAAGAAL